MNYSQLATKLADKVTVQIYEMIKKNERSDKTFTARVTEIISAYKIRVQYCGSSYTVSTTIPCSVDDFVRVCAPCNNWRELFVVENKTKKCR